jgi:hypothetical protein
MKKIKALCYDCNKRFIGFEERHIMHYCPCGESALDIEDTYIRRLGNCEVIETFNPPEFLHDFEYHSALLSWLVDSEQKFSLKVNDHQLIIVQR